MTNLVKKSIDIEKVLEKPHQSCWERLMAWGLSKPAIATIFVSITGRFGKANAFEEGLFGYVFAPVNETFLDIRKVIVIPVFFLILICALLALFKKISWFFVWCILSWLGFLMVAGIIIDSLVDRFVPINLAFIMVGILLFFLPLLISLIQYKHKKIEKKLLKKRFLIWIALLCALSVSLIIFVYYSE